MNQTIARKLMQEHRTRVPFAPFATAHGISTLSAAYDAQRDFVSLLADSAKVRPIGYKVGLTSERMQRMCKINQPIAGVVLSHTVYESGAKLRASDFHRMGIEFEIAMQLAADILPTKRELLETNPWSVVRGVCPAIELIDDRAADYSSLDVLSLIADNSWNAGIVLGDWRATASDLSAVEGVVYAHGAQIDKGWGRDVLGNPFRSLAWVADHLLGRGEHLRAGDIVMTGSLVTTRFPLPGQSFQFSLGGIGSVAVSIS